MIYSLTGKLIHKENSLVVIECGGVGYAVNTTSQTVSKLSADVVTVFTYMHITENSLDLFGFSTAEELDMFKMLISVSGVGPKAALAILSEYNPDRLVLLICSGDSKMITKAQGVGPKLAQRIVLELKDKAGKMMPGASVKVSADSFNGFGNLKAADDNLSQAVSALSNLGYRNSDIVSALSVLDASLSVDDLIREGLKRLAKM